MTDSIPEADSHTEENGEEQQASTASQPDPLQACYEFTFVESAEEMIAGLLASNVDRSIEVYHSTEPRSFFVVPITDRDMEWKGFNDDVVITKVPYEWVESLFDRKRIISLLDLPLTMEPTPSPVLDQLEKEIQKLSVAERKISPPPPPKPMADPELLKRTLIVNITDPNKKSTRNADIQEFAGEVCSKATQMENMNVTLVLAMHYDDRFYLLFERSSHILDCISLIRLGPHSKSVIVQKITQVHKHEQENFLEYALNEYARFPLELKKTKPAEKAAVPKTTVISTSRVSSPAVEPSNGVRGRGPTSGHVARRLVEGVLGIRSTVPREQVKAENQMVATYRAEKKATRQRAAATANQVNEAFK